MAPSNQCIYGRQVIVRRHGKNVAIQQAFDRSFRLKLAKLFFERVVPLAATVRREQCLNLAARRCQHVRQLRSRYGYETRHLHGHVEIALVLHGACRFLIGDKVYRCRSGDVIFVPPQLPHVDAYERADHHYELLWFLMFANHYAVSWTGFAAPRAGAPLRYFYWKRIVTLPLGNAPAWTNLQNSAVFDLDDLRELLLYLSYRSIMVLRRTPPENSSRLLAAALEYINRNFAKPLTVQTLAHILGITPNYLSALFTRLLGISCKQCLQEARMSHAQTLLKDQRLSIKEIAIACGFASQAAFDHLFNKTFGMPPTAYRVSLQRAGEARPSAPQRNKGAQSNCSIRPMSGFSSRV